MPRQNATSDQLSGRSKAPKSSSNKSEIANRKEDNGITHQLDKGGVNGRAHDMHVYGSADSCDSEATRGRKMATSQHSVPTEHSSAHQHDSDVECTEKMKERAGINDELTVPRNCNPKHDERDAGRRNESCTRHLNDRSGISSTNERDSDAEVYRQCDEETSKLGTTSAGSNSKSIVNGNDSDRSRKSSSSRSSRSGENSGSGSNRSRRSNSGSSSSRCSSSGSDSSRSNMTRSRSSESDSSRCNITRSRSSESDSSRSNSTRSRSNSSNGKSSPSGSQSSCEGSANSLTRLARTGAIPRKRDGLTEVRSGSNTSSRLISDDNDQNGRSRPNNRVQDNRERSHHGETSEIYFPQTMTDTSNLGDDGNNRKNDPNHVIGSGKAENEFEPSHGLNHPNLIGPNVHLKYEWQYRDDQGGWATYGRSGSNAPGSKMITSEAIEKYYIEDPDRTPLLIEFNNNKYMLDFQNRKQTSQRTGYQRDFRRILKLPENKNSAQNRGGYSGSRAASGRNNQRGGRHGADYPLNAGDGRPDRVMRYDSNAAAGTNTGRGYAGNSAEGRDDPSVTHEWQFKDKHGKWIAYGNANTFFDKSNATTSRSDDIEKAYSNKHNVPYFVIKSRQHSYMLDFVQMVQINKQTNVQRQIRRVVKESSMKDSVVKSVGKLLENLTGRKSNKKHNKEFTTPHEWQFLDEHGVWITYGQANSAGNVVCTTNTTSDDIEKYVSSGPPKQRMSISSAHNTYSLDFQNMTQTNTRTSIQRPIRRVLKNNQDDAERNYNRSTAEVSMHANHGNNSAYVAPEKPSNRSASTHLWQFEDERGQWITYGESCSTVTGSFTTNAGTDDIEEYYLKNRGEMPMFVRNMYNDYILDFQTMLQTNQSTYVQRRIRRIAKPNEMTVSQRR